MDIQTLGNLGEFIGSLAVPVTLVCLAILTCQTVTVARQASLADILERRQQLDALDAQHFRWFAINFPEGGSFVCDARIVNPE